MTHECSSSQRSRKGVSYPPDCELEDILDPTEDHLDAPRTKDFLGETFRVLKENEIRRYDEYRTRCLLLEA